MEFEFDGKYMSNILEIKKAFRLKYENYDGYYETSFNGSLTNLDNDIAINFNDCYGYKGNIVLINHDGAKKQELFDKNNILEKYPNL